MTLNNSLHIAIFFLFFFQMIEIHDITIVCHLGDSIKTSICARFWLFSMFNRFFPPIFFISICNRICLILFSGFVFYFASFHSTKVNFHHPIGNRTLFFLLLFFPYYIFNHSLLLFINLILFSRNR